MTRRAAVWVALVGVCVGQAADSSLPAANKGNAPVRKYCRFQVGEEISYGLVEGNRVRQLSGNLFGSFRETDKTVPLNQVKLLVPAQPSQILAMAGNYKSHLGNDETITTEITTVTTVTTNRKTQATTADTKTSTETRSSGEIPAKFQIPQPFFKSPSCLLEPGGTIVLPTDSGTVHFEAELVIVIGKQARKVAKEQALDYVLGVTCGNDVSARVWQKGDVQWWRAKGSDTFGPCGPFIVSGLNYDDLEIQLRLNGEVKQKERTSQFIHDIPSMVSFVSQHVTLQPGDLIFTGTPGTTSEMKPGDVVEVELEGVGILRNNVVAEQ